MVLEQQIKVNFKLVVEFSDQSELCNLLQEQSQVVLP